MTTFLEFTWFQMDIFFNFHALFVFLFFFKIIIAVVEIIKLNINIKTNALTNIPKVELALTNLLTHSNRLDLV